MLKQGPSLYEPQVGDADRSVRSAGVALPLYHEMARAIEREAEAAPAAPPFRLRLVR
jgi:hypothetical protein